MIKLIGILGLVYMSIEFCFRVVTDVSSITLVQSISMGVLGGILGYMMGLMNEKTNWSVRKQTFVGTFLILLLEYLVGILLNVVLKLNVWDYSDNFMNLHGQICLSFGLVWFFLVPFALWLDDHLRHNVFGEESNETMVMYYKKLIVGEK